MDKTEKSPRGNVGYVENFCKNSTSIVTDWRKYG